MAERTFFVPKISFPYFEERVVIFDYSHGFALSQQQKSIRSMHEAISTSSNFSKILEVSTKSESQAGVLLSAFNLKPNSQVQGTSVESVYQSSKVFVNGGPYSDIASKSSRDAKKDERLKCSGDLVHFEYMGIVWPLIKSPNFYDYLYVGALIQSLFLAEIDEYEAFTDFAYSTRPGKPKLGKSWNCQARSIAIFKGLNYQFERSDILENLRQLALDSSREIKERPWTLF